jgi:dihydrofolate synthase/folylpolyglutamate synthase
VSEPWSRNYTASAWDDPLDEQLQRLMPLYNAGVRREDLEAVSAIAERSLKKRVPRHVVVVGTNGKTSTAHYVASLLEAAGVKTGLYTSPHIRVWNERVRIGLEPVESEALATTLLEIHEIAQEFQDDSGAVRFFDVLTLTAERLFAEAGVEVGVFEAGIGGRLDATRLLEPELTLLTSIGADHEELLGTEPAQRLREKLGVAPGRGTVIASALEPSLADEVPAFAAEHELTATILEPVSPGENEPAYLAANRALAHAGARELLGADPPAAQLSDAEGRFQHGTVDGVPFIADVAHNPTAWEAFLAAVPEGTYEGVVAISRPRPPHELAEVLARHRHLFESLTITELTVRPAEDPAQLASIISSHGLTADVVDHPDSAFASAAARAKASGLPLLVFGSNYVVVDFLAWVAKHG